MSVRLLRSDDGNKVVVPFPHRNFINADGFQLSELVPIHAVANTTANCPIYGIIAYIFLVADIFYSTIDQLQHQVAVIRFRVWTLRLVPIQLLCGRLAVAVRTFISLWAPTNIQPMP